MSTPFRTKTYVVQREDGEIVGVKVNFSAAQALAKSAAPAKVVFAFADKSPFPNIVPEEQLWRPRYAADKK